MTHIYVKKKKGAIWNIKKITKNQAVVNLLLVHPLYNTNTIKEN